MPHLHTLTAAEIVRAVTSGSVSARDVVDAFLQQIDAVEPAIKAFLTLTPEEARQRASELDARRSRGEPLGPLAGVPVAIKDNICTQSVRTTCASRILADFVPPYDATVVERLRQADAVLVGKTNCDEFAMGSSTENSAFGPTRNPWNLDCVPGGSSGGSAAAVAAQEVPVALGSDTGGSIRQPAALCGVVGLKPTYGRVSRYGLVAYASSLDQIGPFSRTVEDTALLLQVIGGHDPMDSTSVDMAVPDYAQACRPEVKGLRIGVPKEYFGQGVDTEVGETVSRAVEALCQLGAIAEECSLPHTDYALEAYYILAPAEASSNLARYDGVKYGHRTRQGGGHIGLMEKSRGEGFGAEVKQRIMIGTYALSAGYYDAYYKRAQQVRTLIRRDFDEAFQRFDVLCTPTSPIPAFPLGERSGDPLAMKLADICTLPINMAGIPAISVPCGFVKGLPVGLQILAKPFGEELLLRTAFAYQQNSDWHTKVPVVANRA